MEGLLSTGPTPSSFCTFVLTCRLVNFKLYWVRLTKPGWADNLELANSLKHQATVSSTVLHGTALHCTALYWLHCTALKCTALHCVALFCTALLCTVLYWFTLLCTVSYTAPHYIPPCILLHCTPQRLPGGPFRVSVSGLSAKYFTVQWTVLYCTVVYCSVL